MSKSPTVFVKKYSKERYVTREQAEKIIRGCKTTAELNKHLPKEVQRAFLEQDNTKGKGKDDRDLVKANFRKFDPDAIREAMGQPEGKPFKPEDK
jgi:hypothetical protein